MEKKNRYKKKVRAISILRIVFACVLLGLIGAAFVTVRNRHVLKGEEIRKTEVEIADLVREIEMWEIRIAGVKDRSELERRLRWSGSALGEIDSKKIIELAPPAKEEGIVGMF